MGDDRNYKSQFLVALYENGVNCRPNHYDAGFGSYCFVSKVTNQCADAYCYNDAHCALGVCDSAGKCASQAPTVCTT